MVYCSSCGYQLGPHTKFCPKCGTEYVEAIAPSRAHAPAAGASSSSTSYMLTPQVSNKERLAEEWEKNYYRGDLESQKELWTYRNGEVTCMRGLKKTLAFKWTGSELCAATDDFGKGVWNGTRAEWYFAFEDTPFWTMEWDRGASRFHNTQIKWRSPIHWVWKEIDTAQGRLVVEEGSGQDPIEGLDHDFEKKGDFPLPVVLFAAMFRRTIGLRDERNERMNRGYTRCGKMCGMGAVARPVLCSSCASKGDVCICCAKSIGATKYEGKLCKMCSIKKLFCARCGDKTDDGAVQGYLCNTCGLGKQAQDCCRMVYDIKTL